MSEDEKFIKEVIERELTFDSTMDHISEEYRFKFRPDERKVFIAAIGAQLPTLTARFFCRRIMLIEEFIDIFHREDKSTILNLVKDHCNVFLDKDSFNENVIFMLNLYRLFPEQKDALFALFKKNISDFLGEGRRESRDIITLSRLFPTENVQLLIDNASKYNNLYSLWSESPPDEDHYVQWLPIEMLTLTKQLLLKG